MCQSNRLWLFSASTYNPSHIYTTHLQFTTPHTFTQPIYKFRFSFWKVTFLAVYASSYAETETKRAFLITCNINSRTQDQTFSLYLFLLNISGIKVYPCLEVAWHKERLYDFSKGCVTLGHKFVDTCSYYKIESLKVVNTCVPNAFGNDSNPEIPPPLPPTYCSWYFTYELLRYVFLVAEKNCLFAKEDQNTDIQTYSC